MTKPLTKQRLHVGCGPQLLPGWINVDNQPYNGIDAVVDVRNGVPYEDLEFIFAEHFIEHLSFDDAQRFLRDCFWMNKAFRGWGHQFLYNVQTLTECLREAGFAIVEETKYGESKHDVLRGIERHEQYPEGDISHIVIVEASGVSAEKSEVLEGPLKDFKDAVSVV